MLTRLTERDWEIVLAVFEAARSRSRDKGDEDQRFLAAVHYFAVHGITRRALPAGYGNWNSVMEAVLAAEPGRRVRGLLELLGEQSAMVHLVQMFDSTVVRAHVSADGAKGTAGPRTRTFARRLLVQNPPQVRFRRRRSRLPPERRRGRRQPTLPAAARSRPRHPPRAARGDKGSRLRPTQPLSPVLRDVLLAERVD